MNRDEIRVGTRGSVLAMAQACLVVEALERTGQQTRLVVIETEGDRRVPDTAWGEGAFVTAIAHALSDGRVDVAVHSAKDIPTDADPRLRIAAFLERADPRDGLLVRDGATAELDSLPEGARVGTDSPRRTGFLLARRHDLRVHPLHGNVDTRLRRLDAGETDALVLACAGLDRLGLGARIAQRIDAELLPPAPGQGAIAVQVRADDDRMLTLGVAIDHPATRLAVEAERGFLAASGGGCRAPIGALAIIQGDELNLLGGHAWPDGSQALVARRRGPATAGPDLACALAAELASQRGGLPTRAISAERSSPRRVLVTRAAEQADELVSALRAAGLAPVLVPSIAVELEPAGGELDAAARHLATYSWVVITSANGARAILGAAERVSSSLDAARWAALGPATRSALEREGIAVDHQPSQANTITLAA
jgi:hydroxymethylbilane synthase